MLNSVPQDQEASGASPCGGCALVGRRDFLQSAGLAVAGVLVALGVSPALAAAAPLEFIEPLSRRGDTATYPIPARDGAQVDKQNDAIVSRAQGKVYVFSLGCTHQNTAIHYSDGDKQFECPKHHSRFLLDGTYVKDSGRATRDLDRFAVTKTGNTVVANLDALYQQDTDEAQWTAAFVAASG